MGKNSSKNRSNFDFVDAAVFNTLKVLNSQYLPILKVISQNPKPLNYTTLEKEISLKKIRSSSLKRRFRNLISAGLVEKSHYSYAKSKLYFKPKGEIISTVLEKFNWRNVPQFYDLTQFLLFQVLPAQNDFCARDLAVETGLCGYVKIKRILSRFQSFNYIKMTRSSLRFTYFKVTKSQKLIKALIEDLYTVFTESMLILLDEKDSWLLNPSLLSFFTNRTSIMLEILREASRVENGINQFTLAESLLIPIYKIREIILELEQMKFFRTKPINGTQDRLITLTKRGRSFFQHLSSVSEEW